MKNNNRKNKNRKSLSKDFEKGKLQKVQGGIELSNKVIPEIKNPGTFNPTIVYGGINPRALKLDAPVEPTVQLNSNTFNFDNKKEK